MSKNPKSKIADGQSGSSDPMSALIKKSKSTDSADCAAKVGSMDRLISGIWQHALGGSNKFKLAAFTLWAMVGVLWGTVEAQPHKDPARIGFLAS